LCIFTLTAATLLAGCLPEESYESCRFQADQAKLCEESAGEETSNNCLVEDHPQCPDGICISYLSSDPFCTSECVVDDDCPGDGVCKQWAKCTGDPGALVCKHYCIKGSIAK